MIGKICRTSQTGKENGLCLGHMSNIKRMVFTSKTQISLVSGLGQFTLLAFGMLVWSGQIFRCNAMGCVSAGQQIMQVMHWFWSQIPFYCCVSCVTRDPIRHSWHLLTSHFVHYSVFIHLIIDYINIFVNGSVGLQHPPRFVAIQ